MNLGAKIKELRKGNMTQSDLANMIGVSLKTIQRFESNDRSPSIEILEKMAKALNVDITYFLSPESIQDRKQNDAMKAMVTILKLIYDEVELSFHSVEGNVADGPEYDGDYFITLLKNGKKVTLEKKEYEALFDFVCENIPSYIEMIKKLNPNN